MFRTSTRHFVRLLSTGLAVSVVLATSQSLTVDATTFSQPPDGTVVSKVLVPMIGRNTLINIYKIFYMSAGQKVEVFISEPKAAGKYPLFVILHGGWEIPRPSISHFNFGATSDALQTASSTMVIIEPEYRGYLQSDGTVHALAGDTLDAQNAILAAKSFGNISNGAVYEAGYSMGGAVALNLASERNDVKAVVTVSPWVGWDELAHWMNENPNAKSPVVVKNGRPMLQWWQSHIKHNPAMASKNSLLDKIPNIHAPVLFLQGTGDDSVIWQMVQEFAGDMKKAHKTVKLVLYPGGNHGLTDKYQGDSMDELVNWLYKYGLTDPWG